MELIIKNKIITAPIRDILLLLRSEINSNFLTYIGPEKSGDVAITCPWHKDGKESHPSCHVYAIRDNPNIFYGTAHCFTCGKKAPLYSLVGYCLGGDDELGKDWLVERFGEFLETEEVLPEISIDKIRTSKYIDEKILDNYNYFHPYMYQRKLSDEVLKEFKIGYDKNTECLTFPVWDENGHLVTITRRSVKDKRFFLEENIDKPVYLLNFIKKYNITSVYVCESQINALTCWSWGYPAIALFGTGSKSQYQILKKSGIRNYILCFDGDDAGKKATKRFIENMNDDVFISIKKIPDGKDVNDLTREDFDKLAIV